MAFTGSADATQAQSYLEMSGNDLQTAVSLYLEHQGGGGGGIGSAGGVGGGMGSAGGVGGMSSGMGPDGVRAPDQTRTMRLMDFDDDASSAMGMGMAMARMGGNLMDHPLLGPHAAAMLSGAGGVGMGGIGGPPRRGAFDLDDDDDMNMDVDSQEAMGSGSGTFRDILNQAAAAPSGADAAAGTETGTGTGAGTGTGENDGDDEVQVVTDAGSASASTNARNLNTAASRASAATRQARRLREMFAPPTHLMHQGGGFTGARNVAKDTRRWLLVNLQSDEEFACHALNRDVWRDELCENLVREGFIFWQSDNETPEGRTYAQRYNVHSYPHIGILDPRTARLVYRKEGWTQQNPLTPENFAEIAADFCSRHSFDKPPMAPRAASGGAAAGASSGNGIGNGHGSAAAAAAPETMTEEQQLQAAIRASMNDISKTEDSGFSVDDDGDNDDDSSVEYIMEEDDDDDDDDSGDDVVNGDAGGDGVGASASSDANDVAPMEEAKEEEKPPSFQDEIIAMEVGDEPTENAARVMIRMPDGKRLVRRFEMDSTVKKIYAFVAQANDDSSREFELKYGFPPKNLLDSVNESISSAGLAGENITVRWKED